MALAVTALVGVAAVVAQFWLGWILIVAGLGGIISMHFIGGAATASCPGCGGTFAVMQARRRRIAPCPRCGLWLAGIGHMTEVDPQSWEKRPTFCTRLPESFIWGSQCASCDAPATQQIEVKCRQSGIAVAVVTKIQAPACHRHTDPNTHIWLHPKPSGTMISFRSLASLQRFAAQNELSATDSGAAFWEGTDAAQPPQ